jgi:hypothetical protein
VVVGPNCSPCVRFETGPLVKLKRAGWGVGPDGHIDIMDISDPRCKEWDIIATPTYILFDGDYEVARKEHYIDQWGIGKLWATKLAPTAVLTK